MKSAMAILLCATSILHCGAQGESTGGPLRRSNRRHLQRRPYNQRPANTRAEAPAATQAPIPAQGAPQNGPVYVFIPRQGSTQFVSVTHIGAGIYVTRIVDPVPMATTATPPQT